MKKLAFFLLLCVTAVLMTAAASAGTVMYEGGGANGLYRTGYTGAINIELHFKEPFNLNDADYLYLRFYVEDPERYANNGQIEITSSGRCDAEEYSWDVGSFDMQAGWNEWQIDLFTGHESGGAPDMEKINYFRIYFFTEGDNLIAVDYVAFGGENEDFSSIATELGEVKREVHVASDKISRGGKGSSGSVYMQAAMEASPVNIADYDCAFIRFKVDGIDHFTGDGQLELTSSLSPDQKEMSWQAANLDLQDGWNELKLDLYAPDSLGGDFDYEKVNFFRLYMFTEGTLKLNLDYVGFGYEGDDFGYDLPAYLVVSEDAPELTPEEKAAREEAQRIAAEERAAKKAEEEAAKAEAERIAAEEAAQKAAEEEAARIAAEEEAAKLAAEEAEKAAEEAAAPVEAEPTENAPAETAAQTAADQKSSGCGSFIGTGAVVLLAVLGSARICGRKE